MIDRDAAALISKGEQSIVDELARAWLEKCCPSERTSRRMLPCSLIREGELCGASQIRVLRGWAGTGFRLILGVSCAACFFAGLDAVDFDV
jgi:hypothetical protein